MARTNRPRETPASRRPANKPAKPKSEHQEQAVVVSWCSMAFPGVLVFAVPNAAKRSQWEASRLKAEGLRPGIPDLYVDEARGGWFGLRIEMKRASERRAINGGLSDDQLKVREILLKKGYRCVTCYDSAEAIEAISWYLSLPPTTSATLPLPVTVPPAA